MTSAVRTIIHGKGDRFVLVVDRGCPCCRRSRTAIDSVVRTIPHAGLVEVEVADSDSQGPSLILLRHGRETLRLRGPLSERRVLRTLRRFDRRPA